MIFSFPCFYVLGANTDVGKTLLSAGLLQAAERYRKKGFYLKPLQTGLDESWDSLFIKDTCGDKVQTQTLFSWKDPVSPHLAAARENSIVADDEVIRRLSEALKSIAYAGKSESDTLSPFVLVEGAGGVASPTSTGSLQCDVFRRIRMPVVLVGDGRLGGISTTLCAYESLVLRGFDIAGIFVFDNALNNSAALEKSIAGKCKIWNMMGYSGNKEEIKSWFLKNSPIFDLCLADIENFHNRRIDRLKVLPNIAQKNIWWPTTQHLKMDAPTVIDSALMDQFECAWVNEENRSNKREISYSLFDGTASWWTQCLPHGNVDLARNVGAALGRYGHVIFPKNIHEPAARLSELLLESVGKGWAKKVFYSDNGSTAVEAALKMAFSAAKVWQKIPLGKRMSVLGLKNSYHGDTLGAMDASSPNVYNCTTPWYKPQGVWFDVPEVICTAGCVSIHLPDSFKSVLPSSKNAQGLQFENSEHLFSSDRHSSFLADLYSSVISDTLDSAAAESLYFGGVLIEPIIQAAGGMIFVDPLFQIILTKLARQRSIPIIFDEVFTGFWRLGSQSGAEILGVQPDIACYSKSLSGGVVPLAATLSTEEIFKVFLGNKKADALLHGHSFTAYPAGCIAAITALEMLQKRYSNLPTFVCESVWNRKKVEQFSDQKGIRRSYVLGTVVVVELEDELKGYESNSGDEVTKSLAKDGVYIRPMGNVCYLISHDFAEGEVRNQALNSFITCIQNKIDQNRVGI